MNKNDSHMTRGLKNRHLQMIALGGSIGTGLFYGSAPALQAAGPSLSLAYVLGGIIIFCVMRMLGEMVVDEPIAGSFSYFANKYCGEFWGFISGWNYWFCYILVSMSELAAVGIYVNFWFPHFPQWISALICIIVITIVNLTNVRSYGEVEFGMTIIKITAIIAMMVFGGIIIATQLGPFPQNFSNLWAHGGYMPHGLWGLSVSLVIVMFSFGGIELVGITAGEAENPSVTIPKAINDVIWRILLFYIGAWFILMVIYPWDQVGLSGSPFVEIFSKMGIPAAANLLNIVVLTAAVSVYNSAMYSTSRMLYSLSQQHNAPKIFGNLTRSGVPALPTLVSSFITLIAVILTYLFPQKVFIYLMAVVIIAIVISWFTIVIVHLNFRRKKNLLHKKTSFKTFFYPYDNYLCIAFFIFIIVMMTQIPSMHLAVIILPVWLLILTIGYIIKKRLGY
ncbi:amino acid permease [Pectinatus sottacetonis]|uniref:amino acid permease n=1 Tax=Pectinatus sottacetonis TaxID=1002795 RepID=UPI0018C527B7|nr:amino acid permease [Pectinatus sottacetonis]